LSLVKKRHWFWFLIVIIWFALTRAGFIFYVASEL